MKITAAFLRAHKACENQVREFEFLFPDGAETTPENIRRALQARLDVEWLLKFVPPERRRAYRTAIAQAKADYNKAAAPALETYQEAIAPALETYQDATSLAWTDYRKAIAPALETYQDATSLAWTDYRTAIAQAAAVYEDAKALALAVALGADEAESLPA